MLEMEQDLEEAVVYLISPAGLATIVLERLEQQSESEHAGKETMMVVAACSSNWDNNFRKGYRYRSSVFIVVVTQNYLSPSR
jgi:hypothetical protein